MFKNVFSFNGRIRRTEYGISYLIYICIIVPLRVYVDSANSSGAYLLFFAVYIPLLIVLLAQGAKRCHDRGNSGWFQLIPFYVFWMLFADSDPGQNEYGPNPKGIGNYDTINEIGKKEY
ncbi:DUF805 domain-containing protein [Chryseobacterium sp. Alg-005]|uniref:DUF805 domain-containing protein n=1 Tax=Chryseobacterium sp. Alg-005 TaxID=3159516 RepID=UPI003555840F